MVFWTDNGTVASTDGRFVQNGTAQTPVTMHLRVARYGIFVPIFLFSVTGNTLVIMTVLLLRKMKTVPMIFVANLAACDLTTTISSIAPDLAVEELGFWPYGAVLCKVIYPLATFSTNAAALTLVVISIDRYCAIICPLNLRYRITTGKCLKMIVAIHCISLSAVVPYSMVLKTNGDDKPSCEETWSLGAAKIYTVALFLLQYGVPLIVMSVAYAVIGFKLFKNTGKAAALAGYNGSTPNNRRKRLQHDASTVPNVSLQKRRRQNLKTARMFLFVVAIFLVFMMPHQLLWLSYDYLSHTRTFKDNEDVIVLVCRAFTYANSVLNVIVYGVCNGNFRRGCLSIIKCRCSKASQRSQERRKNRESMLVANRFRNLKRHNSSCRSTTDSESSFVMREHRSGSLRREIFHGKVISNGIKNPPVVKPLIKEINECKKSAEIKGNFQCVKQPSHVCENKPCRDLLHEAKVQEYNATSNWLSETEALLKRLCEEIETTGESDCLFAQQRRMSLAPNRHGNNEKSLSCYLEGNDEKETIL